jgi:hypothetical protein
MILGELGACHRLKALGKGERFCWVLALGVGIKTSAFSDEKKRHKK